LRVGDPDRRHPRAREDYGRRAGEPVAALPRAGDGPAWRACLLAILLVAGMAGCSGGPKSAAEEAPSGRAAVAAREDSYANPAPMAAKAPGETGLPRLVELGGEKCIPCRQMAPILEEVGKTYAGRLVVEKLDVQKAPQLGRRWNVRVIPTQVFLDAQGKEVARHEGFLSREALVAQLSRMGLKAGGAAP
jgi:thioredoxin 1